MFDIPIAVSRHTKNTAFATKGMKAKKGGVEKRKLVSKGRASELKLNCRSKAKPKFNMTNIRKCHHPMHGAVS